MPNPHTRVSLDTMRARLAATEERIKLFKQISRADILAEPPADVAALISSVGEAFGYRLLRPCPRPLAAESVRRAVAVAKAQCGVAEKLFKHMQFCLDVHIQHAPPNAVHAARDVHAYELARESARAALGAMSAAARHRITRESLEVAGLRLTSVTVGMEAALRTQTEAAFLMSLGKKTAELSKYNAQLMRLCAVRRLRSVPEDASMQHLVWQTLHEPLFGTLADAECCAAPPRPECAPELGSIESDAIREEITRMNLIYRWPLIEATLWWV